jgi:hypothetical protein
VARRLSDSPNEHGKRPARRCAETAGTLAAASWRFAAAMPRVAFRMVGPEGCSRGRGLGGISAHRISWARRRVVARDRGPGLGVDTTRSTGCSASITSAAAAEAPRRTPRETARQRMAARHFRPQCLRSGRRAAPSSLGTWDCIRCTPSSAPRTAAWWRCVCGAARRNSWTTSWCERRRQSPGAVDRVAQRAAANRARGDRAWRRPAGLKLARALAMATYRSQVEFATALRRRAGARCRSISISRRRIFVRARRRLRAKVPRRVFFGFERIDRFAPDGCPRCTRRRRLIACAKISWCPSTTCRRCPRGWRAAPA